jgi:MoaA/NifB/PqqE/SkfB family radical SAM enzyme
MKYDNLHIIIYLSYECNLRCSYCVINFNNDIISFKILDDLILFIEYNSNMFQNIFIEFIWWEPLLHLEQIKYILSVKFDSNIKFQITTNWTIIDDYVYDNFIVNIDIVNFSYNENYFNNNDLFKKISWIITNKKKFFIYTKTMI